MLARCRTLNERWGVALVLALTLALFARLLGPSIGAADRVGYVAICSGSEIVYVPVTQNGDLAPNDEKSDKPAPSSLHTPCNWLGQYAALLPDLQTLVLPVERPRAPGPQRQAAFHPLKDRKPFHSQAPPSVAA